MTNFKHNHYDTTFSVLLTKNTGNLSPKPSGRALNLLVALLFR